MADKLNPRCPAHTRLPIGKTEAMTATTIKPEQDTQMEPMEQDYVNAYDPRHVDDHDSWDEANGVLKHRRPKQVRDTAMMARATNSEGTIVVATSTITGNKGVADSGCSKDLCANIDL